MPLTRNDFMPMVIEALQFYQGRAHLTQVTKHIWDAHKDEILDSPRVVYTWQYDIRWAANSLRRKRTLKPVVKPYDGIWELSD